MKKLFTSFGESVIVEAYKFGDIEGSFCKLRETFF